MEDELLTAAEMAELAQLDQERTQGKWKARSSRRGDDWGLLDIADTVIVEAFKQVDLVDYRNAKENAAFIAACSVAVPKLLATIQTMRNAMPPAGRLQELARWLDEYDEIIGSMDAGHEMQDDLRAWADRIEAIERQLEGGDV